VRKLESENLLDLFAPVEGTINFYYGRIGSGKTYSATADIFDLLRMGHVVYANWKIDFQGYDERLHWKSIFYKTLFFRSLFFNFPKENLRYFDPDDVDIKFLNQIANADIFIDEGQWIFDSHTTMPTDHKKLILHTRHYNRSLNIISQRTSAIRVDARGNVNRFFKCEMYSFWFGLFPRFKRTEYQDMTGGDVDDSETAESVSVKTYFPKKAIFGAYNTYAMRGADAVQHTPAFQAFSLSLRERVALLFASKRRRAAIAARTLSEAERPLSGGESAGVQVETLPGAVLGLPSPFQKVMHLRYASRGGDPPITIYRVTDD